MVLDHVAYGSVLVVECAASFDAEIFSHGDLNALDVVSIPERLDESVRKAKNDQILHGSLAQVVVNSINRWLGQYGM